MNVSELISSTNLLTDEGLPPEMVVGFLNDAMAKINVETNAKFPYFDLKDQTYEPPFPEKWQRLLLVVFASGRVKQMDSSQFEYQDLYSQFYDNLIDFKAKYVIPEEYRDSSSSGSANAIHFDWGW